MSAVQPKEETADQDEEILNAVSDLVEEGDREEDPLSGRKYPLYGVDGEGMVGATEEVAPEMEDDGDFEYDPISFDQTHHVAVYEMYQPFVTEDGQYVCRICHEAGLHMFFDNQKQYAQHRYKVHGTFTNAIPCPCMECREVCASLLALKKHLQSFHQLPLECHYKLFNNFSEFENWRHMIEMASSCEFILHNRQPGFKRQVMHCSRSEHKAVLSAKRAKTRKGGMEKEGACCPAHISYAVNSNGTVECVYQMYHYGHAAADEAAAQLNKESDDYPNEELIADSFPTRPRTPAFTPMQFIQISLVSMSDAVYVGTNYTHMLVVQCLASGFMCTRSIQHQSVRNQIVRQLVDVFTQFGTPVGFSCCSDNVLFDAITMVEGVFDTQFVHVGHQPSDFYHFRRSIFDRAVRELGSRDRWPEVLPFATYVQNTEVGRGRSPFEMMFNRIPSLMLQPEDQLEELNNVPVMPHRFRTGDKVFIRNFESGPPNSTKHPKHVLAVVGEVAFDTSPHYPYKVFYTSKMDLRPSTDNVCQTIWVSPYDIVPTCIEMLMQREQDRRSMMGSMMCSCKGNETESFNLCPLFRAEECENEMSRYCCSKSERPCGYHEEYNEGAGETHKRLQMLHRKFSIKSRYRRRVRREAFDEEPSSPTISMSAQRLFKGDGGRMDEELVEDDQQFVDQLIAEACEDPPKPEVPPPRRRKAEAVNLIASRVDVDGQELMVEAPSEPDLPPPSPTKKTRGILCRKGPPKSSEPSAPSSAGAQMASPPEEPTRKSARPTKKKIFIDYC